MASDDMRGVGLALLEVLDQSGLAATTTEWITISATLMTIDSMNDSGAAAGSLMENLLLGYTEDERHRQAHHCRSRQRH